MAVCCSLCDDLSHPHVRRAINNTLVNLEMLCGRIVDFQDIDTLFNYWNQLDGSRGLTKMSNCSEFGQKIGLIFTIRIGHCKIWPLVVIKSGNLANVIFLGSLNTYLLSYILIYTHYLITSTLWSESDTDSIL